LVRVSSGGIEIGTPLPEKRQSTGALQNVADIASAGVSLAFWNAAALRRYQIFKKQRPDRLT
jgi:hypothetical protein